jgi:enoyl-CoA hydratase
VTAYRHITYDMPSDGIARITLQRPERLNAINASMSDELFHAEGVAAEDPAVSVLIYRGSGRSFCAGRDLKDIAAEDGLELEWMNNGGWCRPWLFPKMTIAQVHGHAIGGGALLATCCDITIAREDATFGYPEGYLGMDGMDGHPWIWMLGPKQAKDYLLTGRLFSGSEAASVGLVNTAVPDSDDLEEITLARALRIVEADRRAPGFSRIAKLDINGEYPQLMTRSYLYLHAFPRRQARERFGDVLRNARLASYEAFGGGQPNKADNAIEKA